MSDKFRIDCKHRKMAKYAIPEVLPDYRAAWVRARLTGAESYKKWKRRNLVRAWLMFVVAVIFAALIVFILVQIANYTGGNLP